MKVAAVLLALAAASSCSFAAGEERAITRQVVVKAPVDARFRVAWTAEKDDYSCVEAWSGWATSTPWATPGN